MRTHSSGLVCAVAAAMWQERAGTLADRLAASESKLLALKAPQSPLEGSGATIASDPTTESLWTRWRAVIPPWLLTLLAIVVVVMLLGWPS